MLDDKPLEQIQVKEAVNVRKDRKKIEEIILYTHTDRILEALKERGMTLTDVSFETQDDEVGPSDVILYSQNAAGEEYRIGLSIKYANSCRHNPTGRKFITKEQQTVLKQRYHDIYFPEFLEYMREHYGHVSNWHRKRSDPNDRMIDEIRNAVIENWPNIKDKISLMKNLFHATSPIEFWEVRYNDKNYDLQTVPSTIDTRRADEVEVRKHETSYIAFCLDDIMFCKVQVKFNNGFIESNINHKGNKKKKRCDFYVDGLEYNYGKPFGSWNFSVE